MDSFVVPSSIDGVEIFSHSDWWDSGMIDSDSSFTMLIRTDQNFNSNYVNSAVRQVAIRRGLDPNDFNNLLCVLNPGTCLESFCMRFST